MPVQKIISALVAIIVLIVTSAQAQQAPVATVADAQQRLLQLMIPVDMDTDVPAPVKEAIGDLKQALAVQTDMVIFRLPAKATAEAAQKQLSITMPADTADKNSDKWGRLTTAVKQLKPSLLLVQESFEITCGIDTVLLVYGNDGGTWKRILLWQSAPYDSVGGAFGDVYETLLLKPEIDHHPLLLVVHGTPWCSSTRSAFNMDVFKLGVSAPAKPIWHRQNNYRRFDAEPPLTVQPTADGFEVRTNVNVAASGGQVSREGILRYVVTDDIYRVEPLAMNARDSVEEWLGLPKTEATEFTDEPTGSLTWKMFQDFTYYGKSKDAGDNVPYPHFGAVRACKDTKTHFQAEMTSEILGVANSRKPGPSYFVQLREVPNGYRIHAVTQAADKSCHGPNLSR